jgi:hypothetical protein
MVASNRSGDRDPLLEPGVVRGGEPGELMVTDGVSCGVERKSIDIGRVRLFLDGETDRPRDCPGL